MKPTKAGFSPQRLGARQRSALTKAEWVEADMRFMLSCSQQSLEDYELRRLSESANILSDFQELVSALVDVNTQVNFVRLFRGMDRDAFKRWITEPLDVIAQAKAEISRSGRTEDEIQDALSDALSVNPGQSHRTAARTYQKRNQAQGKCIKCPKLLDSNSTTYCMDHLRYDWMRHKPKGSETAESILWLMGETPEISQGRTPKLACYCGNGTRAKETRDPC